MNDLKTESKSGGLKAVLRIAVPWTITIFALYYAFRGVDWHELRSHMGNVHLDWLLVALALTSLSYLLRARRWQYLFPTPIIAFSDAARVLFLGFFMNNILPARAGEIVRAHLGSKVTGETRTLVLATILNERLADGLTLSLFFMLFAVGVGDQRIAHDMLYVAGAFAAVGSGVCLLLVFRNQLFRLMERAQARFDNRASQYTSNRVQTFINGLAPLCTISRIPVLLLGSLVIWIVELLVYVAISAAFGASLPLQHCVLFLVAVNFSSLIPSAPGGIGVIEAVTSAVLVSIGIDKELALTMVLCQHIIQYLVVGTPGVILSLTWKDTLNQLDLIPDERNKAGAVEF